MVKQHFSCVTRVNLTRVRVWCVRTLRGGVSWFRGRLLRGGVSWFKGRLLRGGVSWFRGQLLRGGVSWFKGQLLREGVSWLRGQFLTVQPGGVILLRAHHAAVAKATEEGGVPAHEV